MADTRSLSLETTSTFTLDNTPKMNVPDFYVFCSSELFNQQEHHNTSIKQHFTDFNHVKKYLMKGEPTSPCKTLVFKQAIKVIGKNLFFFPVLFVFVHSRNAVVVVIIIF
jgi:hypothetical protein